LEDFWARIVGASGQPGLNYWEYFGERLAHLATIPKDAKVLDIGTYDGNVLFQAMKKMKSEGYGVGADIYSGGFNDGVAEAVQRGWEENISFVQVDANALGFISETFHIVLANFVGWDDCFDFNRMDFISSDNKMSEIIRVLGPGGQVGIGSWVEQRDIDWIIEAFRKYLPEYRNTFSCYGKENPDGYKVILQNSGFKNIRVNVETTNFISPDAETWWRQMKQAADEYFKQISDPNTMEKFKEQVFVDLQEYQDPEGTCFSKTVSYVFGTKPI
jgi:ubiquinone/menaquinone biosynthesis C-methylase UbiE